jgi:hypothetical protein
VGRGGSGNTEDKEGGREGGLNEILCFNHPCGYHGRSTLEECLYYVRSRLGNTYLTALKATFNQRS